MEIKNAGIEGYHHRPETVQCAFCINVTVKICQVRKSSQQFSCLQNNSEKISQDKNGNIYVV